MCSSDLTIMPWLRRLEINFSKLLEDGTDLAFDTSVLLRTDALTRAQVNMLNIEMGARTPNEVRQIEGLEPYQGGDAFVQAVKGSVVAGGQFPILGKDEDPSAPVMGVLE